MHCTAASEDVCRNGGILLFPWHAEIACAHLAACASLQAARYCNVAVRALSKAAALLSVDALARWEPARAQHPQGRRAAERYIDKMVSYMALCCSAGMSRGLNHHIQ